MLEHRLAWLWHYGVDPGAHQIDHANGVRSDNRLSNLRLATNRQNSQNLTQLRSRNTSGVCGVGWSKVSGKWRAYITVDSKQVHLGLFSKKTDAIKARYKAEALHYREFAPRRAP